MANVQEYFLNIGFLKLYKSAYAVKKKCLTMSSERMSSLDRGLFNIREIAEVSSFISGDSRNSARVIAGFSRAEVTSR